MYLLQSGLNRYFKDLERIGKENKVRLTDSPLLALLIEHKIQAIRFKELINKDYNCQFVIIELCKK